MGTFLSDVYINSTNLDAVRTASGGAEVSATGTGWTRVSVGDNVQDERHLTGLAQHLSGALSTRAVATLVHDSDVFRAWLHEDGALSGQVDTWPSWPDGDPVPQSSGHSRWLAACAQPPSLAELKGWFTEDRTFAEDAWYQLAQALGIRQPEVEVLPAGGDLGGLDALGGLDGLKDLASSAGLGDLGAQAEAMFGDQLKNLSKGAEDATQADTAFVEAASVGDLATLRRFAAQGHILDAPAKWKPHHARSGPIAAMMPSIAVTALYAAAVSNQVEAIELLCELGADPEHAIPNGDTPLCGACTSGNVLAAEALLDEGVDPDQVRGDGQTALTQLRAARAQLSQMRSMMQGMPMNLPGMPPIPTEADLAACEALLIEAAAD